MPASVVKASRFRRSPALLVWLAFAIVTGFILWMPAVRDPFGIEPAVITSLLPALLAIMGGVLAVVVTFYVVLVQILREETPALARLKQYRSVALEWIVHLLLVSLVLGVLGLLFIDEAGTWRQERAAAFAYWTVASTLGTALVFYPLSRQVFGSPVTAEEINGLMAKLGKTEVNQRDHSRGPRKPRDHLRLLQENPLEVLIAVARTGIARDNRVLFEHACLGIAERLLTLVGAETDDLKRRSLYDSLGRAISDFVQVSIRHDNRQAILTCLAVLEDAFRHAANLKATWVATIELERHIGTVLHDIFEAEFQAELDEALWMVRRVQIIYLRANAPLEQELWSLFLDAPEEQRPAHLIDKSNHWDQISHNFVRLIEQVFEEALRSGRYYVARESLHKLGSLSYDVLEVKTLGPRQKRFYLNMLLSGITYRTIELLKRNPNETDWPFVNWGLTCKVALNQNDLHSRWPLIRFSELLLRTVVEFPAYWSIWNEIGTMGRHYAEDRSQLAREVSLYIGLVFADAVRGLLANKEFKFRVRNLRVLEEQLDSLASWNERADGDPELAARYRALVQSIHYAIGKQVVERIEWPTLP